jgi:hypothetical protein
MIERASLSTGALPSVLQQAMVKQYATWVWLNTRDKRLNTVDEAAVCVFAWMELIGASLPSQPFALVSLLLLHSSHFE